MPPKKKPTTALTDHAADASPQKLLSRAEIQALDDSTWEDVAVPEWGGLVRIKGLSGTERDAFEASSVEQRGKSIKTNFANLRARLVVAAAVDADGIRMFSRSDIDWLGAKSAAALDRCFSVAQRLSRLSDEDIEELAQDFDDAPSDSSTSG